MSGDEERERRGRGIYMKEVDQATHISHCNCKCA